MRRLLAAAMLLCLFDFAAAQPYPVRSIRLIVATEPGGQSDALARAIAPEMSKVLGQSVVAENRGGAGGTVGATAVSQAAPDGYTLLVGGGNSLVNAPLLNGSAGYDPLRQFAPIGGIARVPYAIAVAPHIPARDLTELLDLAKARPGALTYGSGGIGSTSHVILAVIEARSGTKFLNVPYRNAGAAVQELLGGRIDVVGSELSRLLPHARSGAMRVIATTGNRRAVTASAIATVAEQRLPGFDIDAWFALLAPAGTPDAIVAQLSRALATALRTPEIMQMYEAREYETLAPGPEALRTLIATETRDMRTLMESTGLVAVPR